MLRVTCNNVVQQHLTVVQQLQQLSLVVLSYYYHREIFAGGGHKKAHRFTGGLGQPTTCRLFGVFNYTMHFQYHANRNGGFNIAVKILMRCVAQCVLKRGNALLFFGFGT